MNRRCEKFLEKIASLLGKENRVARDVNCEYLACNRYLGELHDNSLQLKKCQVPGNLSVYRGVNINSRILTHD